MRVTIKDVAKEAGVSIATVSRVLNGSDKVSNETKKKVIKAIRKLGYKPTRFTKPITGSSPSRIIGILVPDVFAYHYSDISEGAIRYLKENGYEAFIYTFHRELEEELHAIDYLFMSKVDGIIVCTSKEDDVYLRIFEETAIPVVTVDREIGDFRFDAVNIDNYKAGKMVAQYLYSKGHRKVVHITGDLGIFSIKYRMEGFLKKAKKIGMEVEVIEGSFEVGRAYELMKERIKRGIDFTAIFASADILAVEVMKALSEEGISVPDEVSVMGFDDAYFSRFTVPSLTTVRQPRFEMGLSAAQLLLSRINGSTRGVKRRITLPVEVIERESVSGISP